MGRAARVVIIDEEASTRALIKSTLSTLQGIEVIGETDSLIYGYEMIRQNRPHMVFVDLRHNPQKTLEMVDRISTYFKDTMIVVSGLEMTLETTMASMQAGAREYLKRPLQPMDIADAVEKHRKALTLESGGDTTGRILTVFSNKGGLGKTSIAVNLALALSEAVGKPVALVDLNLQLGDITTFLDITPKQTIVDIAKNIARVDAAYLESSLAEFHYGDSQIYVLADPLQVEDSEEVTAEQINTVLTVLKATFEYVIIDTTTSFDSKTLTALDAADNILLVSMVNLPSIRSTQRVLSLFDRLGYDKQKIKILVNRFVPGEEITIEDVEETLNQEVFWKIPNNYQVVMTAINRGIPIMAVNNSESIHRNFLELAYQVSGVVRQVSPAVENKKMASPPGNGSKRESKGLLGSLFGRK